VRAAERHEAIQMQKNTTIDEETEDDDEYEYDEEAAHGRYEEQK